MASFHGEVVSWRQIMRNS